MSCPQHSSPTKGCYACGIPFDSYDDYLVELDRVKTMQCKRGDHSWVTAYPHTGSEPFCSQCGIDISKKP